MGVAFRVTSRGSRDWGAERDGVALYTPLKRGVNESGPRRRRHKPPRKVARSLGSSVRGRARESGAVANVGWAGGRGFRVAGYKHRGR
jgi:hypothetical protein